VDGTGAVMRGVTIREEEERSCRRSVMEEVI